MAVADVVHRAVTYLAPEVNIVAALQIADAFGELISLRRRREKRIAVPTAELVEVPDVNLRQPEIQWIGDARIDPGCPWICRGLTLWSAETICCEIRLYPKRASLTHRLFGV